MFITGVPTVECEQESTFCEIMCLTYTCITYLGKGVSSSALPFNSWAYHLCLNFLLFRILCLEELSLREIRGRPLCIRHPRGRFF